jgi:hypothetical protein
MSALPPKLGKPAPSTARVKVPRRNHIPASQLPVLHHFVNGIATQHFARTFFAANGPASGGSSQPTGLPTVANNAQGEPAAASRAPIAVSQSSSTANTNAAKRKAARPPPAANEPGRITAVSELPVCLMKERKLPERWPHRCYWDHHEFDSPPVGLPIKYDATHKTYHVFGVFCSYNCAAAFSADSISYCVNQRARLLLFQLLRELAKADGKPITVDSVSCKPSPHWSVLNAYGGPMNIADFRKFTRNRRLGLHVYPPWIRLIPIGYLMYAEDRAQPLPSEFSANYTVVTDGQGAAETEHELSADARASAKTPKRAKVQVKRQEAPGQAPSKDIADLVAQPFSAPAVHGQMFDQWNWTALQNKVDRQIASAENQEQLPSEQKQLPLSFKRNILTGRREAAPQPTDAEIDRRAASLRTNALPSLRVDPRQPNIALQLSKGTCNIPAKTARITTKNLAKRPISSPTQSVSQKKLRAAASALAAATDACLDAPSAASPQKMDH